MKRDSGDFDVNTDVVKPQANWIPGSLAVVSLNDKGGKGEIAWDRDWTPR